MKYIYRISFIIMILNSHLFGGDVVANAGEDTTLNVTPSHKAVHLDGSESSSSNNIVSYKWYEGDKYIGDGKSRWYGLTQNGEHIITLKVVDEIGERAEDSIIVTVINDDAPVKSNLKANAGEDKTLNVTSSNKAIHLDGGKSNSENKIVSYKWYDGDKYIGSGKSRWYGLTQSGEHNITLKIVDETGKKAEDSMTITVVNGETPNAKNCDKSTAITREELIEMIKNSEDVTQVNTCMITDMSDLFKTIYPVPDISGWDVSNVTNMSGMFSGCISLPDISGWDVSNVTNMSTMFAHIFSLSISLNGWDVSNVRDMSSMFLGTEAPKIDEWDVSNVTNMRGMFFAYGDGWGGFSGNLASWDVSNVRDMSYMFASDDDDRTMNNPKGIENWDVSNVTKMKCMFKNASTFNQPLENWDVSKVTDMEEMFYFAENFNQPLGNWDVSNVTNMSSMFRYARAFNQPLEEWDVSKVTDMSRMFDSAWYFNQAIGNWDVSKVTNMSYMFAGGASGGSFNQPIEDWDVSNVTDMRGMFYTAIHFNQSLKNWDVSNVTDMSTIFENALTFNQPIENWDVSNVTNMGGMFQYARSFNKSLKNWDVSNVTNMSQMFYIALSFNQNIKDWDVSNVTSHDDFNKNAILEDAYNPFIKAGLLADAGEDRTLNITPSNRAVYLDGSKSSSENKIVSYNWYDGDKYIGSGKSRWYGLNQNGEHTITLKVVDETGEKAKDSVTIMVLNRELI